MWPKKRGIIFSEEHNNVWSASKKCKLHCTIIHCISFVWVVSPSKMITNNIPTFQAKPAPRTSTTKPGSRSKAKMTTVHSESRSGASSSASEKPEKLSRVITSPYTCKLNPAVTTKNRAQSASSLRQKESFSPNVKVRRYFFVKLIIF